MPLTEDKIKAACLRFLKAHYKFRPRVGPTTSKLDLEGDGGIIADGQLQFITEDNQLFIATFEATSEYLYEEVKFNPELRVLFWDGMAAAFITAAAAYSYGLIWDQFTIRQVGWVMTLSVLFLAGFVGFWIFRYVVRSMPRYRYIYAIEQFKRYHADEQWIAIADTIFPNSEDKYYDELRRQCIRNGIGLVAVERDESVQLIISPARQEVFSNKRRLLNLVQQEYHKGRSWSRRFSDRGRNFLDQLFGRARNSDSLQRFRRSFYLQIMLCFGALGLIATIFHRQWQDQPIAYVNESRYGAALRKQVAEGAMETLEVQVDTAAVVEEGLYEEPYLKVEVDERLHTTSQEVWVMQAGRVESPDRADVRTGEVNYDCERFHNFEGALYLIKYAQFVEFGLARDLSRELKQQGLNPNILWRACFENGGDEYLIHFDLFFPELIEAESEYLKIQRELLEAGLPRRELALVRIEK